MRYSRNLRSSSYSRPALSSRHQRKFTEQFHVFDFGADRVFDLLRHVWVSKWPGLAPRRFESNRETTNRAERRGSFTRRIAQPAPAAILVLAPAVAIAIPIAVAISVSVSVSIGVSVGVGIAFPVPIAIPVTVVIPFAVAVGAAVAVRVAIAIPFVVGAAVGAGAAGGRRYRGAGIRRAGYITPTAPAGVTALAGVHG